MNKLLLLLVAIVIAVESISVDQIKQKHYNIKDELNEKVKSITVTSPTRPIRKLETSSTGYYYLRTYSDKCKTLTSSVGYAVNYCFVEDNFAFKYMISQDDDGSCNTLQVYNYIDDKCETLISISESTPVTAGECIKFDTSVSDYATQACTTDPAPPAAADGAIMMYSNYDQDCDSVTAGFLQLIGCYKYGGDSFQSSCTAGGTPQYTAWSKSKCSGSSEVVALPTECTIEDSYFFFDADSSSESDSSSSEGSDSEETGSEESDSEETGSEESDSEETGSEESESEDATIESNEIQSNSASKITLEKKKHDDIKKGKGHHSKDSSEEGYDSSEDEFSAEWVTASPSASTTSFPTSVNSSYINVKYVCGAAPTAAPTVAPTVNDLIMFDVQQIFVGIDYSTYEMNSNVNEQVIKETIAGSMNGVSVDDIVEFEIEDESNEESVQSRHMRRQLLKVTAEESITADYTIMLRNGSLSYNTLTQELDDAVTSGSFDQLLSDNAVANGATSLVGVTSNTLSTENLESSDSDGSSGSSSSGNGANVGMIVGIVIAVIALLLIAAVVVWFLMLRSKSDQTPTSNPSYDNRRSNEESIPLAAMVVDADDKHAMNGRSVTAEPVNPRPSHPHARVTVTASAPIAPAAIL
jgi:hypothetical protein